MSESICEVMGYPAPNLPASLSAAEERHWLLRYMPLVKRIVNQLSLQASPSLDRSDMEQIGLLGLLEGLRRYGVPDEQFGRFVALRVRGAILDELRRQDWRPRLVRQHAHKTRDDLRELTRQLGRPPRDEEVRAFTGLSSEDYQSYLRAQAGEALESLDQLLDSGAPGPVREGSDFAPKLLDERLLSQALAVLDERERLVLTLYYQHELSLKEVGLVLDVSDARVCQLCKQAIAKASAFLSKQ